MQQKSFPTEQSFQELSPRLLHGDLLIHTELGTISPVRLSKPQPLALVRPGQPDKAAGLGKGGEGGVQQRQVSLFGFLDLLASLDLKLSVL